MKDHKSHKLKFNPYLEKLYQSDKPLIIYKVDNGYDIYTDFSKKINLTKKNIHKFLNSFERMKYKKDLGGFLTLLVIAWQAFHLLRNTYTPTQVILTVIFAYLGMRLTYFVYFKNN